MKISYDSRTDTLTVIFREAPVAESDEANEGFILDYNAGGELVSLEVLDASIRVDEPGKITLCVQN